MPIRRAIIKKKTTKNFCTAKEDTTCFQDCTLLNKNRLYLSANHVDKFFLPKHFFIYEHSFQGDHVYFSEHAININNNKKYKSPSLCFHSLPENYIPHVENL